MGIVDIRSGVNY